MTVDEIVAEVESYDANHVVLTGGEPLVHEESVTLLDRLSEMGYHTTVETNGTIFRDAAIDLASVSPKLASSTPTPENDPKGDGEWEERHEERRIDVKTLAASRGRLRHPDEVRRHRRGGPRRDRGVGFRDSAGRHEIPLGHRRAV